MKMASLRTSLRKYGMVVFLRRSITAQSVPRPKKETYPRLYKTRVIRDDGSSYMTRYHEPVGVIRLPVDPNTLTEEQKKTRLKKARDEKKVELKEYKDDVTFDRRAMARLVKKSR